MQTTLDEMTEKLKAITGPEHFAECVGSSFRVQWEGGEGAQLELVSARSLGKNVLRGNLKREPFSLVFRAGSPQFYLPQRIYRLEHEKLGALELFLVPIGPDENGMRFEAIFN